MKTPIQPTGRNATAGNTTPRVPPGYKQTEVGVIPEDWEVLSFGEIFTYLPTATNSRSDLDGGGDTYYIHYGDIHTKFHNHLDFSTTHPPRIARSRCRNAALLKNGDWVMADASEDYDGVGKTIEIQGLDDDTDAISGLHTFALREKTPIFAPGFKGHLGNLKSLHGQYLRVATGMKVYGVSKTALRDLPLPVPTLAEQEAIATALSDADALIDSLEQLIAKKRLLKQGAMQDLLTGKKRLPGFEGEWEVKKLGALGSFSKGNGVRKHEANSGQLACIRYGEIYTRHHDWVRTFYSRISPAVAATARRLSKGDLLFAGSGETREEIGKCVAFLDDEEAYAGGDIVILRPADADSLFMGYYLNTPPINDQKAGKGQGDAVVHISANALADIDIKIPEPDEQTAVAAILSDMDLELAALEAKLAKARQVKQSMMQELLTGKTRLV